MYRLGCMICSLELLMIVFGCVCCCVVVFCLLMLCGLMLC